PPGPTPRRAGNTPAPRPTSPSPPGRANPAAKTILRSLSIFEELHRSAAARPRHLERGLSGLVADVGTDVPREQEVDHHDVVVRDRGVQGRVALARVLDVEVRSRVGERLDCEEGSGERG